MKPTIKITFDSENKEDEVFYISYEKIKELIKEKYDYCDVNTMDIIDVEVFG